ncbi:MAG: hypothetical protein IPG58_00680 [Acidobacteria bacterium]|nr:hypothetical protein [Acidobacteriota bacterium]
MRSSTTCCPHSRPQNFGIPKITPDEKLEFVEHVLGVLIESRFGPGHGYTTLGEAPVTTGHSQMFANVRLLTEAEIEGHLDLAAACQIPFYATAFPRENHLRKRVVLRDGQLLLITSNERSAETSTTMSAMLKPPAHAGGSPSRGSLTFSGTFFFATPFANFA